MIIKNFLQVAIVLGCIVNNIYAMEKQQEQLLCTISNTIKLDEFWQKVKSGDISKDKAEYKLCKKVSDLYDQKRRADFKKAMDNLLKQAICAGINPSTPINFRPQPTIIEYALDTKKESLIQCCLEQGYSPDSIVLSYNKKVPILAIAPSCMWPIFKKYGANFNVVIKNNNYETLLHKAAFSQNAAEAQWLLQETSIDTNQPNGNGDTAGHQLTEMCERHKTNEKETFQATFKILTQNGIDPFQRNNENYTAKDIAKKLTKWYQEKLSENSRGNNIQERLCNTHKTVSLWEEYEKEYLQNSCYKNIVKHCYCGDFTYANKNDRIIQSQTLTSEQIFNAYSFFPDDSIIGLFCKHNIENDDCIAIAKLYTSFNAVHHIVEKRENISAQLSALRKEKTTIFEKLETADIQWRNLSNEEELALLNPEIRAQLYINKEGNLRIKKQLSTEEKIALCDIIDATRKQKFGITDLNARLDVIDKQLTQLNIEWNTASQEENKKHEITYGYHSTLDFNICSGKTTYHRAVKNLLEMVPSHELKMIEAKKINQGLHNAYHNKKQ